MNASSPPPASAVAPPVIALVRDLMFSSRIVQAGRHAGVGVKVVRDPAKLAETPGRLLIVDLNLDDALSAATAWRSVGNATLPRRTIGFVQHVDTDRIRAAREAGLDEVMPRSQFVTRLPDLLRSAADPPGTSGPEAVGTADAGR